MLQIKLQPIEMDMFDLENDLPDELMQPGWGTDNSDIHTNESSATGPGPGSGPGPGGPLIGAQDTNSNPTLHRHVNHPIMHPVMKEIKFLFCIMTKLKKSILIIHVFHLQNAKNVVTNTLLSGGGVLNKVNKTPVNAGEQMVVNLGNISNFPNVPLTNQSISISLGGMQNNIVPTITSGGVMTNSVLNASCK